MRIEPEKVEVFYEDSSIGWFNEYEFNEIRIQIAEKKLTGFSMESPLSNGRQTIDKRGRVFFDKAFELQMNQLMRLL